MKILIGYDGSETADLALDGLADAGLPDRAEAVLLVAIPPMVPQEILSLESYAIQWYADAYAQAISARRKSDSRTKAKGLIAARRLKKYFPGWKIRVESRTDVPSHAILDFEGVWKPDLTVLGSHGWNPVGRLLLGSVAEKVLTHARGNVRIGKAGKAGRAGKKGPPRILIGFDGSKESRFAVESVADRDWPKGTEIKVVAVNDFRIRIDQVTMALPGSKPPRFPVACPWTWMDSKLAKARERLSQPGVEVEMAVLEGDPRHVLLEEARRFRASAIVLGNRGLTGFKRFLLGSVSTAVASHSPCSIEVIRRA
ncbi:MAG: Universal stress protein UspA-like nucleotide-binding protein [Fibrobacteres bacterium]|nr:Universal stress protein UspA-like nucleotide-binding protein [Fibrobacterota bacterium]